MIDELKEEEIVNKVGGRFKLSTLIQKRMIALNQGRGPWSTPGRRQDDDRDPGDHAGEDLSRPLGQAADSRADRRAREQRRNRRSYPTGRLNRALSQRSRFWRVNSQGPRIAGRSKGGSAAFPTRISSGLSRTDTGDVGAPRG